MCVQINDAPAVAEADLSDETQHRRLLPGQGDFDLVGLIKVLDEIACSAPIGVEIFSDAMYAQPVGGAAQRSAEAVRAVLRAARGA